MRHWRETYTNDTRLGVERGGFKSSGKLGLLKTRREQEAHLSELQCDRLGLDQT